jgi:hypothetical protein
LSLPSDAWRARSWPSSRCARNCWPSELWRCRRGGGGAAAAAAAAGGAPSAASSPDRAFAEELEEREEAWLAFELSKPTTRGCECGSSGASRSKGLRKAAIAFSRLRVALDFLTEGDAAGGRGPAAAAARCARVT